MRGLHSFCDQGRCGLSEGQGGRELLRLHKEAWAQTNPTGTWEGRGRQRNGLSEADEEMVFQRLHWKTGPTLEVQSPSPSVQECLCSPGYWLELFGWF